MWRLFWRSGLSRWLWGGITRDKSLPALRAFQMFRVYVCSLFWRDAVRGWWRSAARTLESGVLNNTQALNFNVVSLSQVVTKVFQRSRPILFALCPQGRRTHSTDCSAEILFLRCAHCLFYSKGQHRSIPVSRGVGNAQLETELPFNSTLNVHTVCI